MTYQSEVGGMGCKRLDITRYWTHLKAAGYDPCVTYAGMVLAAAGKEPLTKCSTLSNDSHVTCNGDFEGDEKVS